MAKKIDKWAKVRDQIAAGNYPAVFVTADGKLGLDGKGRTLPADIAELFPAEIRQAAEVKAARIAAERAAEKEQASIAHRAKDELEKEICHRYRNVRAWRLAGFYVEDLSMARYTLAEIEAWIDWDAYNLRHKHPEVVAILGRPETAGGDFRLNISARFWDAWNDSRGAPTFETLCERLASYVAESWGRKSRQN